MKALAGLCCGLLLGGCHAQDPTNTTSLYPLKIGNKWTYRCGENRIEVEVKGVMKIGKDEAFELMTSRDGTALMSEFIAVRADGIYCVRMEKKLVIPPLCILKLPVKKGESWKFNSRVSKQSLKGSFAVSESKGVKVPAGTYDA